jgi:hypothetical protein
MAAMEQGLGDRLVRWAPLGLLAGSLVWMTSKAANRISDPDDWWHLRLGNELLRQHSFATPGWSSYADQGWVPTEPVPEIFAALVERWFGYPGLAWVFGVALFAVTVSIYVLTRDLAHPLPAVVVTCASLVPLYGSMTSRPHLTSFLFLALVIRAWIRTEQDLRPRWWLIPVIWIWSLCHGFWFIGAAYGFAGILAVVVRRRASARQLVGLAGLVLGTYAVVLLNPVGPRLFEEPFKVNAVAQYITEWQRPSPFAPGPLWVWIMVCLTLGVWAVTRRGCTPFLALLVLSSIFWVWYAERTIIIATLAVAPALAAALEAVIRRTTEPIGELGRVGRTEWNVIGATFAVSVVTLAAVAPAVARDPGRIPLSLDSKLDRVPAGSGVITDYVLGGWIAWRHPALNQYIDGLATPYSRDHYLTYFSMENHDPGWYRLVVDSHLTVAVVRRDSILARGLLDRGWIKRGSDRGYVLLTRPGVPG